MFLKTVSGIHFTLKDLAGNPDRLAAQILGQWDTGTGSYPGALSFWTRAVENGGITERMRIDSQGNIGLGTTAPKAKLQVSGGDVYTDGAGQGVIMKSPNGNCYKLTVSDSGALATSSVPCP